MNIRKIAEMCGVSVSTVSRILNNRPDVNEETRENVIRFMNDHGFRPAVVANRQETVGIVTPDVSFPEYMGELMNGLMEQAYAAGLYLMLVPYQDRTFRDAGAAAHFCRSNGLRGLIAINPPLGSPLPGALVAARLPHVVVAASYPDSDVSWVDVDNADGCRQAVRHLLALGHRRIALLHPPIAHPCDADRAEGYREALREAGMEADPGWAQELNPRREPVRDTVRKLLHDARPTAVFCSTYRGTLAVSAALGELGLRVPADVAVAGFGDYDVSPLMNPPMTTVHQPIADIGRTAVAAFGELLRQTDYASIQRLLPARLIVRASTKGA
ncbi:LacI family transcriptional regulator [Paenibacillus sp. UNC496MF]|uniref:LacI family DNA-binding transcriptional regulator n=1 Tax=Paenibacillus sp. UNC496MF TaxID=1502753 RepID=UPI0008E45710|nr:LacI family DNA-binding transcriptional regulator [Paenibacillus sp. UNC496MF]SFI39108.1 LacI family transcriptional regulator [Paenibacillus sp. UNC496MF]